MAFKKPESRKVEVSRIDMESVDFYIIGKSALVYNAMSAKTMDELLFPSEKLSQGERRTTLKHDPYQEYRDSVYRRKDDEAGPTRLTLPSRMFKAAMVDVITVVGGSTKVDMKRLLRYDQDYVDIYGVPQLYMAVVRQAGMNRTPDVRTRAIVKEWCCKVQLHYVVPNLNESTVANLLLNAGELNGVGDARQQKGAYDFGRFEIAEGPTDPRIKKLLKLGMKEQDRALRDPVCYDQETTALLAGFDQELARRKLKPRATTRRRPHSNGSEGEEANPEA